MRRARWKRKNVSAGRSAQAQTSCRRRGTVGCPARQSETETRRPWGNLWPGEVQGYTLRRFSLPLAGGRWESQHEPTQQLLRPPGQRVAKRNARKEERVKCVLAPRPKMHRAAGINHQVCTAPCRARSPVLANTQAPSHADPRTATLHARAKLRPKAIFSLPPGAAHSLFVKNKKRMGGASPVETAPWREPDSPSHGTHHQPTIDKGSKL